MKNFLYELAYIHNEDLDYVADSIICLKQKHNNINITRLQSSDIDSLTKDSPIHLFRALYTCKSFAICKENNESFITQENASKILGYKSDFANIFVYGKDSLSNEYLEARKALYKTMMNLRKEREQEHKEKQEGVSQLSYEEYTQEQREKQRQVRFNRKDTSKDSNHLILESNDKSIKIIFLDKLDSKTSNNAYNTSSNNTSSLREVGTTSWQSTHNTSNNTSNHTINQSNNLSLSNLIHLYNNKIDIFTKNGSEIDIAEIESLLRDYKDTYTDSKIASNPTLDSNDTFRDSNLTLDILNSPNTQIFLYSTLLHGSKEIESHPLYFGELDKEGELIESKPIYYLQGGEDIDSVIARNEMTKQSTNNNSTHISTSTLQIFLHSSTLTILNYSILDSSLHIKLECNSSESQEIEKKEKALLESTKDSKENKE
ncbi:hypothetical protein CCZ01_06570, partial [Helicobacter monodelphidis]